MPQSPWAEVRWQKTNLANLAPCLLKQSADVIGVHERVLYEVMHIVLLRKESKGRHPGFWPWWDWEL